LSQNNVAPNVVKKLLEGIVGIREAIPKSNPLNWSLSFFKKILKWKV